MTVVVSIFIASLGFILQQRQAAEQARQQLALQEKSADQQLELQKKSAKTQLALEETKVNQEFWKLRAENCMRLSRLAARVAFEQGKARESVLEVESLAWGPSSIVKTLSASVTHDPPDDGHAMRAAISAYLEQLGNCQRQPAKPECWEKLKYCAEDIGYGCASALCGMFYSADEGTKPTGTARTICSTEQSHATSCPTAKAQAASPSVTK